MKLSTKLLAGFASVGAILAAVSGISSTGLFQVNEKMTTSIHNSTLIYAAMEMKYAAARDMQMLMEILAADSAGGLQRAWQEHQNFIRQFDTYGKAMLNGAETEDGTIYRTDDEGLRAIVTAADQLHNSTFAPSVQTLYDLKVKELRGEKIDRAEMNALDSQADEVGEQILEKLGGVEEGAKKIINQSKEEALAALTRANWILAIATILGLAMSGVLGVLISRSITRPVAKAVAFTEAIASGNLTQQLDISQKDEIGAMAASLNAMVAQLRSMIAEIVSGVSQLTTSSHDLDKTSNELSLAASATSENSGAVAVAAEEMSANVQTVASSMEQSAAGVNMVASSSEEMSATVSEIARNTEKARAISEGAVNQSESATVRMGELTASANRISRVTETITEISEQTNLLALNATIEAARAGDAGKGFAVVANEIKELARQTASATVDIKRQIEEMQTTTTTTVADIRNIAKVIVDINSIIGGIAAAVEEQSTASAEISTSIAQASQGISEVNENVAQTAVVVEDITRSITGINQQSSQVSKGSNQVKQSVASLAHLAGQLDGLVRRFAV